MNQKLKDDLLKSAISIGDEIVEKALIDSKGIYWRTVSELSPYNEIRCASGETIFSGTSGIILFYIELYKKTKDKLYLDLIHGSAEWLIHFCKINNPTHGFYSGRLGVVYVLLKIAKIDKKEYYQERCLTIAEKFKDISEIPVNSYNIFNGLSGTILGLLHLYNEINEEWILESIKVGIDNLLRNSKSKGIGLYWDFAHVSGTEVSIKPLCSYALGSSGIGFLFLQLSAYFENADYKFIAEQAFLYENQFLDSENKNWPNFQLDIRHKESKRYRRAYLRGNYSLFKSKSESNNWLYGITGIGLTRLYACKLTGNKTYQNNLTISAEKLKSNLPRKDYLNYTLATGEAGIALFLVELSQFKKESIYFEKAIAIANESIAKKQHKQFYQFGFDSKENFEDNSLLMGNAGIGYFYLKLLNHESTDNILLPQLLKHPTPYTDHPLFNLKKEYFLSLITRSWYPHTLGILEKKGLGGSINVNFKEMKKSLVFDIEQKVSSNNDSYLTDAFNYEHEKHKIQNLISANYCLYTLTNEIESINNRSILNNLSIKDLMKITLLTNPYVIVIENKSNWFHNQQADNSDIIEEEVNILYIPNYDDIILTEMEYIIFQCFYKAQKVKTVYRLFIEANEFEKELLVEVENAFVEIIKSFLNINALICPKQTLFSKYFKRQSITLPIDQ